jgi:cyanophycin synthetase
LLTFPNVRLVEIRLLEGPNVYRLGPTARIELAIGRSVAWRGQREPRRRDVVRLAAIVRPRDVPDEVAAVAAWMRRLRADHGEGVGSVVVHRAPDPGRWVVTCPWSGAERARAIAEAAVALAGRAASPARRVHLTGAQERALASHVARIAAAGATPPAVIADADRRIPIVSISGTNGKSTVTRLISHILVKSGRHVGTTTSDGILVDERLIEPGDWTGPGGAATVLGRIDVDVAVLETARGGILLRGVGYESNEAAIVTNVSSDHLDLQGIHTLPELAEVKATICRITRPDGWVILNADDRWVAPIARRVRARVAFFSLDVAASAAVRGHRAAGGRCYLVHRDALVEEEGGRGTRTTICDVDEIPIALGGLARHNVANALAAAAGARALGATVEEVARGLRSFRPSIASSPGRLNIFRFGTRTIIVDFAHNEAGVEAIIDVAEALAAGSAARAAPVTVIVGTAGDRPADTLTGIGRIAGRRADRVAIKETRKYLRGRSREEVVDLIRAGIREAGVQVEIPVYASETEALRAELAIIPTDAGGRPEAARVIVLLCQEERDEVIELLAGLGARPVETSGELAALAPRLQRRPHRD